MTAVLSVPLGANAAAQPVDLGTAASYSVLGGQTVTNTGPTTMNGDLGVSPGTATTGFPPGTVGGTLHANDAHAAQAQSDLVIAYDDAAGRAATASVSGDLVGQTLPSGVYSSTGPLELSGTLTLDGEGDPNSVFIFQTSSTLITASSSTISLINDAQACNVYWQVGSSATLGTASTFVGTIMALTSISVTTDTVVEGRVLARNGQVSLDTNTFIAPGCEAETPTVPPTVAPTDTETEGDSDSTGSDDAAASTNAGSDSDATSNSSSDSDASTESAANHDASSDSSSDNEGLSASAANGDSSSETAANGNADSDNNGSSAIDSGDSATSSANPEGIEDAPRADENPDEYLSRTGAEVGVMLAVTLAALILGTVVLLTARRRRNI